MRKRPSGSVTALRVCPCTVTCAPATGRGLCASTTRARQLALLRGRGAAPPRPGPPAAPPRAIRAGERAPAGADPNELDGAFSASWVRMMRPPRGGPACGGGDAREGRWDPASYQLPRSPTRSITRARRSAAFRQLAFTASSAASGRPVPDAADDGLVLRQRGVDVPAQRGAVQPAVAFRLGLYHRVHGLHARPAARVHVRLVKARVQVEEACRVRGIDVGGEKQLMVRPLHRLRDLAAVAAVAARHPVGRQRLQLAHDPEELAAVLAGERRHGKQRPPPSPAGDHVAFPLQPVQRAADGRTAGSQPLGQLALDHAAAGRQAAVHDQLAKRARTPRRSHPGRGPALPRSCGLPDSPGLRHLRAEGLRGERKIGRSGIGYNVGYNAPRVRRTQALRPAVRPGAGPGGGAGEFNAEFAEFKRRGRGQSHHPRPRVFLCELRSSRHTFGFTAN